MSRDFEHDLGGATAVLTLNRVEENTPPVFMNLYYFADYLDGEYSHKLFCKIELLISEVEVAGSSASTEVSNECYIDGHLQEGYSFVTVSFEDDVVYFALNVPRDIAQPELTNGVLYYDLINLSPKREEHA